VVRYDARVLTPRPWTLLQSRWAAELAVEAADGPILELCAGAGQIGLAASVLTGRALVQVEADEVAAGYARTNAALTGRADQVEVRHGRVEAMLATDERFPIVLADPPYLPSTDVARWPDDPLSAIDGGKDGLELVRTCLRVASDHLQRDGVLLLQVAGAAQADAVTQFLASAGHIDLATIETRHHDSERAVMLLMHTAAAAGGRVDPA
jgi:methylase of polypeptide subunit release factors